MRSMICRKSCAKPNGLSFWNLNFTWSRGAVWRGFWGMWVR